jgi:hypothetical protein
MPLKQRRRQRAIGRFVLTLAAAAAIAGGAESARAISPTMDAPVEWRGGVEIVHFGISGAVKIYTVPAAVNFLLTDLVVSNDTLTPATFSVFTGTGAVCNVSVQRTSNMRVPPDDTLVVSLTTGIGFGAGQSVCIASDIPLDLTGRGFLFVPAPAS